MKINWSWPCNGLNGLLPWYVIAKNTLAVPFLLTGGLSLVAYFAIVKGPRFCVVEVKRLLF